MKPPITLTRRQFLASTPLLAAQAQSPASTPTIGDAPQLFVDLDCVASLENVRQVFHSAEKHPDNPVLRKEKPWETDRGTWGSVSYDPDERIFKAWYGGESGRFIPGGQNPRHVLCYATSHDGVHWDRPNLGLHEVMGSRDNNVVVGDEHHDGMGHWESTLKDRDEPDPQRRYKAVGWSSYDWDGPMSGIYTMTSPDGLRWTHTPEPVFHFHPRKETNDLGPVGDAQSLMIDPLQRRYVAYLRGIPNRLMSVSRDFVTWTPPRICIRAREDEKGNAVYNHVGFVYGDRYLGFLTYLQREPELLLTVRLLTSRDGEQWQRPDTGRPLIDVGEVGASDRFTNMLTGAPPIRMGDKLYIYYRGMASRHSPYTGKDTSARGGGIGLATIRPDGFASLNAPYDEGRVTTRPFLFRGVRLQVNAKADFGELAAEVLDDRLAPMPGFSRQECLPMRADSLEHTVRWKDATLASLAGRPVSLRFHLQNARLYSYRIVV
jgi:hypothetical protein